MKPKRLCILNNLQESHMSRYCNFKSSDFYQLEKRFLLVFCHWAGFKVAEGKKNLSKEPLIMEWIWDLESGMWVSICLSYLPTMWLWRPYSNFPSNCSLTLKTKIIPTQLRVNNATNPHYRESGHLSQRLHRESSAHTPYCAVRSLNISTYGHIRKKLKSGEKGRDSQPCIE